MTGSPPASFSLPKLSLIIGGARSGKSAFAERLVLTAALPGVYIATAEAWDDEMRARIARHRADRGPDWQTLEVPLGLGPALASVESGSAVLIDCATLWLSNQFMAGADIDAEVSALLVALAASPSPVVVVSNEVGWSIVPENHLARAFRDHQGRLNQRLAAEADLVVAVIAGLPMVLKGELPAGAL